MEVFTSKKFLCFCVGGYAITKHGYIQFRTKKEIK